MRIAFLSTFPPEKCGIAIYSDNLLSELKKLNPRIIKVGSKGSDSDYKLNLSSFSLKKNLKEIIKTENIDMIHVQHNYPHFSRMLNLNLIRCLDLPVPVIITLHEVQYTQKLSLIRKARLLALQFIEKKLVKKAARIIVHTEQQKRFLEKKYHVRVECIYHGLNLLKIGKKDRKELLFLGIITPAKGVEYLIKAMCFLKEYHLTIAGSIPDTFSEYRKRLESLIEKPGNISYKFKWVTEKEKGDYYKKAGIVVLPYIWSPYQSGILHNALSYGIPVVVTKVGALWEIVNRFKIGEIVPPKSPKKLADAIKEVSANYGRYMKGIKNYRSEANWKEAAKRHFSLYKKWI